MVLETIEVGGCRSYILGCSETSVAAVIDPEISAIERYRGLASKHGLTIRYVIDTHTLRSLDFMHAAALDGGMKAWGEAGLAIES